MSKPESNLVNVFPHACAIRLCRMRIPSRTTWTPEVQTRPVYLIVFLACWRNRTTINPLVICPPLDLFVFLLLGVCVGNVGSPVCEALSSLCDYLLPLMCANTWCSVVLGCNPPLTLCPAFYLLGFFLFPPFNKDFN